MLGDWKDDGGILLAFCYPLGSGSLFNLELGVQSWPGASLLDLNDCLGDMMVSLLEPCLQSLALALGS